MQLIHNIREFSYKLLNIDTESSWKNDLYERLTEYVRISADKIVSLIVSVILVCIGLNTDSTMAIIGGLMLFPIVAPFYGLGHGLLLMDFQIIQLSIRIIFLYLLVSIVTSIIYFTISPIYVSKIQIMKSANLSFAELFVAMIAGIAGYVSIVKNNSKFVLIVVQIASAFLVPLCLVGYSIGYMDMQLMASSIGIFLLISFFLFFGALVLGMLLGIYSPSPSYIQRYLVTILGALILVVGVYFSTTWLKRTIIAHNVESYLTEELSSRTFIIQSHEIDYANKKIDIYYSGNKPISIQDISLKKKHKINGFTLQFFAI